MTKKLQAKIVEQPPFTRDQVDLIKATVAKGSTDPELQLFLYTCKRTGLDPLTRQIHAVKRWDSSQGVNVMSIQTGIDGYRLVANRTGQHMGTTDVTYDREDADHPSWAKVTVYRQVNGEICEFTATARWSEYVALKKDGQPMALWKKMPYLMLGKCAEALALRKAFPQELGGIYTFEEMEPSDGKVEVAKPVISGSGPVAATEGNPTGSQPALSPTTNADAPAPAAAARKSPPLKRTTKLRVLPSSPQSNYSRLLEFLHLGNYTGADFLVIAHKNKWILESVQQLQDVPDPDLAEYLKEDSRQIIADELEKLPRHTKD